MPMNIFTYGTLMYDAVWQRVIGVDYEKVQARIHGYRRRAIAGEAYPALIPGEENEVVDGVLHIAVKAADVDRLDRFEGDYYRRIRLHCRLADGRLIEAAGYRFKDKFQHMVEDRPWDIPAFESSGINRFLSSYRGFSGSAR